MECVSELRPLVTHGADRANLPAIKCIAPLRGKRLSGNLLS